MQLFLSQYFCYVRRLTVCSTSAYTAIFIFQSKKLAKTLAQFKNSRYLCIAFGTITKSLKLGLSYGVMVALQFLVLPVLVRIQVRQHKGALRCSFFYFYKPYGCGKFPHRIPHQSTHSGKSVHLRYTHIHLLINTIHAVLKIWNAVCVIVYV